MSIKCHVVLCQCLVNVASVPFSVRHVMSVLCQCRAMSVSFQCGVSVVACQFHFSVVSVSCQCRVSVVACQFPFSVVSVL